MSVMSPFQLQASVKSRGEAPSGPAEEEVGFDLAFALRIKRVTPAPPACGARDILEAGVPEVEDISS